MCLYFIRSFLGKPIGNGHPMAVVVTRRDIAQHLLQFSSESVFTCDVVAAAIGLAVLNTVRAESLKFNAEAVGTFLREGLRTLASKHKVIG